MKIFKLILIVILFVLTEANGQTVITGRAQIGGDTPPSTGAGVEIGYNAGSGGQVVVYDRAAAAYKFLNISGSELGFMTNANERMRILPSGNVGIGTNAPGAKLDVKSANRQLRLTDSDDNKFWQLSSSSEALAFRFQEDQGDEQLAMYFTNQGRVGIGTTTPGSYKLAVEGKIGAREVNVTAAAWSDYVFSADYKLRPLSEVQEYIEENHHLPEVPSEKEVLANGQNLGEMNALLLKKIEELTLYVIELKKEIDEIKKQKE